MVLTLNIELDVHVGIILLNIPFEFVIDEVTVITLQGELGLVLVVVVSLPGEDGINLGAIRHLNSLLDLLASLLKSSLHQLLAVEFNLSHVTIHVLDLEVLEPFSLVPLTFNFKVVESCGTEVKGGGHLLKEVLAELGIVLVLGGHVDLLGLASILIDRVDFKVKLVKLGLVHAQLGVQLEGSEAVEAVHLVEHSVEWVSVSHEPVHLGVKTDLSFIDRGNLGYNIKFLIIVVSGS